ncbi:uncharacterized protein LOC123667543 [Melitaea cinxia]|uniref:uncharacterized protein LOC123667543 n=1 Tax=Melitaea cinxia TaxID=113334 RepID=UPI001E271A70|nr:uncharacterized protein LOC123667543 [Melitaea cinxia]
MSATSALESNEDLENIPLVRMEDVQPDRSSEMYIVNDNETLETCVVDDVDYNVCVNDEEHSNIGSMVSIHSEEVTGVDDSETPEFIVPEVLPSVTREVPLTIIVERAEVKQNPDSWPTLEILPGGVIKHAENYESDLASFYQSGDIDNEDGDMMYACAKCPERFKFLFCLVKHVKWHEDQKKKEKQGITGLSKIKSPEKKYICLHANKRKVISKLKTKCKVPKKS